MMNVTFLDFNVSDLYNLKYAVVCARYKNKWIFCKHKERTTWEIPGGHHEINETIEDTANRELREETGAKVFTIRPVSVYCVESDGNKTYGALYFAEVFELDSIPSESEIEMIALYDALPRDLTYPHIQPYLFEFVENECLSINQTH